MNKNSILTLAAALWLAATSHISARTWTDAATGRTLEGDYITSDATHVVVKSGGRPVKIAIARLSETDKAFIRKQAAKPAAAPAQGNDLESRLPGYWAPDVKKTTEASEEELSPLEQAFLGKFIFEFQQGTLVTHALGGNKNTENYTVKGEDKAGNTLILGFTNRETTVTLQGAQLTMASKDGTIVCNRITKEEFEKRFKDLPTSRPPRPSPVKKEKNSLGPLTILSPGPGEPTRQLFSATVNDLSAEFLAKINASATRPEHVVIGKTCSNEDFATVCSWPWIREMRIESKLLTDIRPLAKLTELTSLELFILDQTKTQRIDIGASSALKKLERIEFYSSRVTNTNALAGLTALKDLSLYMSDFESLDFLEHTPAIERLSLFGSRHTFDDYKPVLHLKNLRELNVTSNPQAVDEKLKELEGLTTLEKFSMALCTKVTTLDFLRNCKGLRELNAKAGYQLEDVSALAGFPHLEKLNLSSVPLEDIAFLEANPKLQELDLSGTEVRDISVLSACRELVRLNLEDTEVTDLSPLLQLDALPQLELPEGVSEEVFAALRAKAFSPEEMKRLAPTGLTFVVCDADHKVLDTLVIPNDNQTVEVDLSIPEGHAEIRVFVVGQRERICPAPPQAGPDTREFYDDLFKDITQNYFAFRPENGKTRWSGIAKVEKGAMEGMSVSRLEWVKPLRLTGELKKQIHEDIAADERTPIFSVSKK